MLLRLWEEDTRAVDGDLLIAIFLTWLFGLMREVHSKVLVPIGEAECQGLVELPYVKLQCLWDESSQAHFVQILRLKHILTEEPGF